MPQIWLQRTYANYVDPSLWDEGINAAMLSYTLNGWRSESPGQTTETSYAGLMGASIYGGGISARTATIRGTKTKAVASIFRINTCNAISPPCVHS